MRKNVSLSAWFGEVSVLGGHCGGCGRTVMSDLYFNWNAIRTNGVGRHGPPTGTFFDETLRDGIQAPHVSTPSLADKLDLVDLAVGCGVRSADLGFPGSSP